MSKKKYNVLSGLIILTACLIVIFHIPFLVLILGSEAVFRLRGLILLVITPLTIIFVSVLSSVIIGILKKKLNSSEETQGEKLNETSLSEESQSERKDKNGKPN